MKIIIVGTAHPFRGGLAAFNERLAREFQSQGHEVEMYTFTLQYPSFLFPGKTQFSSEEAPSDLIIHRTINSINPISWIKTGLSIRKKKADKLIFCYWMAFMAPCFGTIARLGQSSNTKILSLVHNMIPHEPTLLDKLLPSYFVSAMDGFVAMAQAVVNDIRSFDKHNKPVCVSPHPVYDHFGPLVSREHAASALGLTPEAEYLLFFGLIRHYKGLDLLLQAFADSRLRQYPVKLIVAGEYYEPAETYLDLIDSLGIREYVELRTEFVPDSEVKYYFSLADLIAQPYRTATQSGVSQIAYFFEKPMLVTNVGGLAEIVPQGKVGYVTEVEISQIADALVDFFANRRKDEFADYIKEEKKKYEWSAMTEAFLKV